MPVLKLGSCRSLMKAYNRLVNAGYMSIEREAKLDVGCILASCMSINTDWWTTVRQKPVADPIYRPVGKTRVATMV